MANPGTLQKTICPGIFLHGSHNARFCFPCKLLWAPWACCADCLLAVRNVANNEISGTISRLPSLALIVVWCQLWPHVHLTSAAQGLSENWLSGVLHDSVQAPTQVAPTLDPCDYYSGYETYTGGVCDYYTGSFNWCEKNAECTALGCKCRVGYCFVDGKCTVAPTGHASNETPGDPELLFSSFFGLYAPLVFSASGNVFSGTVGVDPSSYNFQLMRTFRSLPTIFHLMRIFRRCKQCKYSYTSSWTLCS